MSEFIEVGTLQDIPPLGSRIIKSAEGDIALFRTGNDDVFALTNRCPHKGGPLSEGIVHGNKVTCPLHNWVIELDTGNAVAPDEGCAGHYAVRMDGDTIFLGMKKS